MPDFEVSTHRLKYGASAAVRRAAAAAAIAEHAADRPVLVITPSIEAGSRLIRLASSGQPAVFGWQRTSVSELAARLAACGLASRGLAPVGRVVLDAVCARAVHRLRADGALGRYERVGDRPGLPRALARTFVELGLAGIAPSAVDGDLGRLYAAFRRELADAGLADRGDVLAQAALRVEDPAPHELLDAPIVLLDVPVPSALDQRLVSALARRSTLSAFIPTGDGIGRRRLEVALEVSAQPLPVGSGRSALDRLREQLFADEVEHRGPMDPSVELLSAPGESRECVEIARRALAMAREGTPFDRMAVLAHSPERYRAHLVEAFRRAGIEACFSRGTVRPDPSGRALLALLACREQGTSARAFAEYLSLGQVPEPDDDGGLPDASRHVPWLRPDDELSVAWHVPEDHEPEDEGRVDAEAAVVRGTLRAPWRWERLIVDAAVIGGGDRWRRRLDGLDRRIARQLEDLDVDDPKREWLDRERLDLGHLARFALPLIDALHELPREATWGEWTDHLERLARRSLREPARVLAVLRELGPMAPVGPVGLTEVQLVLARRLSEMVREPSGSAAGKLFVGSTSEARGLSFDVVFAPGLVERVFPRKVNEDPIALDDARAKLSGELATTQTRVEQERLALRLAIGAAERRLVLSYPRLDTERGRPRVPSFYALEVLRAIEGTLPSYEELARRAEAAGAARMAWPAPRDPKDAIDDAEYDLAVLHSLLDTPQRAAGATRYLIEANPHVANALRARHARWSQEKWTGWDGLVNPSEEAAAALAAHALDKRPYSATALEQLAQCPYRFYLRSVVRLASAETPEALEELDPLSRGRLIHAVQFALLARLSAEGALPVTEASLPAARRALEEVAEEVTAHFKEELAPAIERVFDDAVDDAKTDLAEWLLRMSEDPEWVPVGFELSFGLPIDAEHDRASVAEPVTLEEGITLRGSIDLVEQRGGTLRATDHKTGAYPTWPGGLIRGGKSLQPVLYARVLETLHPDREVAGGRLYYCTSRGHFEERHVPLSKEARAAVAVVAGAVKESIDTRFLPALPEDGACERCDYRCVCGPAEPRRVARKQRKGTGPVRRLRKLP